MAGGKAPYDLELPGPGANRQERMRALAQVLNIAFTQYNHKLASQGKRPISQAKFSNLLGIGPSTLSYLMTESRLPSDETMDLLAAKLGPIIYRIFDRPARIPKDRAAQTVFDYWTQLTEQQRKQMAEMAQNWASDNRQEDESLGGNLATA